MSAVIPGRKSPDVSFLTVSEPLCTRTASMAEKILQAVVLRDQWLSAGLSVLPADRAAAEAAVCGLYRLAGLPLPGFAWVPSPAAALAVIGENEELFPPARPRAEDRPRGDWPAAARLAGLLSGLRGRLDARVHRSPGDSWLPQGVVSALRYAPEDAVLSGIAADDIFEATVYRSLRGTLRDAVAAPLRAAAEAARPGPGAGGGVRIRFWGQHEAYWVAHYDVRRRAGLGGYCPDDLRELELWAVLARSAAWWWPGEGMCVVAERPAAVHTEPLVGSHHGELRLHRDDGAAVAFSDGWGIHVLHGTPVPEWVITGPTVERVRAEPNVEVRRSAIERIGWDAYIGQAALTLIADSPDPGNPGVRLSLYDDTSADGVLTGRVLLVTNGSPEPDGHCRRYGINVPAAFDDPVVAAAWTYGLAGTEYAQLARRT